MFIKPCSRRLSSRTDRLSDIFIYKSYLHIIGKTHFQKNVFLGSSWVMSLLARMWVWYSIANYVSICLDLWRVSICEFAVA